MPVLKIHSENEKQIHFLTFTVIEWIDIFTNYDYFEVLIDSMKYCQKDKGLKVWGFVLMTNHMHVMWQADGEYELSEIVQSYKRFTTKSLKKLVMSDNRKYIKALIKSSFYKKSTNTFQIWQEYNYPVVIESEKFFWEKLNYIHNNPVRKGYVTEPENWMYSSARNYYLGLETVIKVEKYE